MSDETRAENEATPGVIDGMARVLAELLRTPRIAKAIRIALDNLDPEAAPRLVRTLVVQDSALFFDLVTAAPRVVNGAVLGARELGEQLLGLPRELTSRFLPRLLADVSAEQLGEAVGLLLVAGARVAAPGDDGLAEALARFDDDFHRGLGSSLGRAEGGGPAVLARLIDTAAAGAARVASRLDDEAADPEGGLRAHVGAVADAIRQLGEDNPNLVAHVLRPLAEAWREALKER